MEINITTGKIGNRAYDPVELSAFDFWIMYIRMHYTKNVLLNDLEEKILAYILANGFEEDHFSGKLRKKLEKVLAINTSRVSMTKKTLTVKNLLTEEGIPTASLTKLAKAIMDSNHQVSFVTPIHITTLIYNHDSKGRTSVASQSNQQDAGGIEQPGHQSRPIPDSLYSDLLLADY